MRKILALICSLHLLSACNYLKPEAKPEAVARVNESYLYRDDIRDLVPEGTLKQDSAAIIRNFIDRWATQRLLIERAEINLNSEKKEALDKLVRQYKSDLYTKAYIEEIVKQSVDTTVAELDLKEYYDENKENFRTNGLLVKLRYIHLQQDNPKFATIKSKFFDFRKSDRKFWDAYSMQFKSSALNDTVWVDIGQVYAKLPFINPDNRDQYIVSGKSIQYPDSTDIYLVKVTKVLDPNNVSPYEYIKPTLREVIVNQRKLELIKKFEKEITDDAIKDNNYEIYK